MFFSRNLSREIWVNLSKGLLNGRDETEWQRLLNLMSGKGQQQKYFLLRYVFQATAYGIWRERNARRHGESPRTVASLIKELDRQVRDRIFTKGKERVRGMYAGLACNKMKRV